MVASLRERTRLLDVWLCLNHEEVCRILSTRSNHRVSFFLCLDTDSKWYVCRDTPIRLLRVVSNFHFVNSGPRTFPSNSKLDLRWEGDQRSKFVPSNITTTSFSSTPDHLDPSVHEIPYSTARIINTSSFTYIFHVSPGPKFLRLHFYPAAYSSLDPKHFFFSVSSNGHSLLTNFSAFLAVSFLTNTHTTDARIVKEFLIHVNDAQILNVTFTPSPNSYAFINGIEILSIPENLYFDATTAKYVIQHNMGGGQITGNNDTGMYRSWDQDNKYIYGAGIGLTPTYHSPITYTIETPNYTAPELVYQTQRSMGNQSDKYNLTWMLPVDSGFYYMLRLHFCNIIPLYTKPGQVLFTIFINNQTAEEEVDLFHWTKGSGYPVFKDYIVFVHDRDGGRSKQDSWLAMHPNTNYEAYGDAYLNGLEVFKLSDDKSLANPNPELTPTTKPTGLIPTKIKSKKSPPYAVIIGGIGGAFVLLSILILLVFQQRRRVKHYDAADDKSSYGPACSESRSTRSTHSTLPSDRCRRFSLKELKAATDEFDDIFIIGNGGFGKVYKGHIDIDNAKTIVAIKRLDSSSTQGFQEFHTEIGLLSKLRHVQLVSLIGYCDDEGEMILVYDYMAHGTLREHLYKTNKPPLSWKRRLNICIGAARGLHYLHTGAKRAIIHRDVKSTNILLDENFVAKVSDFGLSKIGPRDQAKIHVRTVVKGSIGTGLSPELRGVIAPECLRQFGVVVVSCLSDHGSDRPTMDEVVWGLEFALELQEGSEKTDAEATNITDEDVLTESAPIRNGAQSLSSS
ncbi:putative protein kinase RLK-Pelle-CrRLK1L-1 family [Helianthus anomalus]